MAKKTTYTAAQTNAIAAIADAASASFKADANLTEVQDLAARLTGVLYASVSTAFDLGVKANALAKAATVQGRECDDTTAGKFARAGRIVLIDKPQSDADPIYAWGATAYTAVCAAVKVGVGLPAIDRLISKAASTDEAITAISEATKTAKDAKKAAKEAEAEAEKQQGEAAIANATDLLDAALKCLRKAVTEAVLTSDHLSILQTIAREAGEAGLLLEAEPVLEEVAA